MHQLRTYGITLSIIFSFPSWAVAQTLQAAPQKHQRADLDQPIGELSPYPSQLQTTSPLLTQDHEPLDDPCPPGAYREAPHTRCLRQRSPEKLEKPPAPLPPPQGVIVLKPGGVRELADFCPEGFSEVEAEHKWRFCVHPGKPEVIPPMWAPPIAGIPYEKALEIHSRHQKSLMNLPGVDAVGLGEDGIHVYTTRPDVVPSAIEGLPIKIFPSTGPAQNLSHTLANPIRPLHGAINIRSTNISGSLTLTGVALSDGHPWLILPAHASSLCTISDSCADGAPKLNQCPHYSSSLPPGALGATYVQPSGNTSAVVGLSSRWERLDINTPTHQSQAAVDVAAIYLDNDQIEGNGLLSAERTVEISSQSPPTAFSGLTQGVSVGNTVYMRTYQQGKPDGSHQFTLRVIEVGLMKNNVTIACQPGTATEGPVLGYRMIESPPNNPNVVYLFSGGDSGAPVFSSSGHIVGMVNGNTAHPNDHLGFGHDTQTIQNTLRFDKWYGTQTVIDNTIGVARVVSGALMFYVDNGNGKFDGPCSTGSPTTTRDQCFGYGSGSDIPISGDWDNATLNAPPNTSVNDMTAGYYRLTTNPTLFSLSNTNNPPSTSATILVGPSSFGYKPVTGRWQASGASASHAMSKIGVFRPSTGGWYLDNGNKVIEACDIDYCFFLAPGMYQPGDIPIAGDWNGDGVTSIGLFRPGTGTGSDFFYLSDVNPQAQDIRNNGTISSWSYPPIQAGPASFGYLPLAGNWTGMTRSGVVVFKSGTGDGTAAGGWYLDNGNLQFLGCAEDQCPQVFGQAGDKPVAFGKSIVKAN